MSLVMLYLVTFDDFGLIHQTKRALKSNRTNLLWGAFFCTLLFSQKTFCTIQVRYIVPMRQSGGIASNLLF